MTEIDPLSESVAAVNLTTTTNDEDDVVDPWNVTSKSDAGVDYDKLISKLIKLPYTNKRKL